jgi:hypothetical protein
VTHPYKEILIAIANGESVQWQSRTGEWQSQSVNTILAEIAAEIYAPERYRIKPPAINIDGIEVPEPVRSPLKVGDLYWSFKGQGVYYATWIDHKIDHAFLANGWIHLTKEAAETHHRALISFTKREEA